MKRIIVYTRDNRPHKFRQFIDAKERFIVDLTKLEAETGDTISSVTWIVDNGAATIENETLSSSVAAADITTTQTGRQLIKASCLGANGNYPVYIDIKVNDPKGMTTDYGCA